MRRILLLITLVAMFDNPVNEQMAWNYVYTKDGIEIYNRTTGGTDLKEFKGEVKIRAALSSIIAVLSDIDNYTNWVYQTRKAEILKKEGDIEYIHVVIKAQWPVQDRDIIYKCEMSQNPKTREVTITMSGIPDYIPPQKDVVRMPSASGLFILTPLENNEVKITYQLRAVSGGQIPQWMADLVVVDSPYITLHNLREEIKKEKYRNSVSNGIARF